MWATSRPTSLAMPPPGLQDTTSLTRLLGLFLSPWKSDADRDFLKQRIASGEIPWEGLLLLANRHLVSPLLCSQLEKNGFLPLLPDELRQFLGHLHSLNQERNQDLTASLGDILSLFAEEKIPAILLKGAATFCDDLYEDHGARMLQDIDLLVPRENSSAAWKLLLAHGWRETPDPGREPTGLAVDARHHHLLGLHLPGTPVKVEIHYKIGYGTVADLLTPAAAWLSSLRTSLGGQPALIPDPAFRLMHNAAHALIGEASFIRGEISLQQLADFAWLSHRYNGGIDWHGWLRDIAAKQSSMPFLTYLELARRLFAMPIPAGIRIPLGARLHAARMETVIDMAVANASASGQKRWQYRLARGYYFCRLPGWIWDNVCYAGEEGHGRERLRFFVRKLTDRRSWKKI